MTDDVSDEFRLDFTDVGELEVRDFKPIPSGRYPCTITDASVSAAKDTAKYPGEPVISLELSVFGTEYDGRKIWDRIAAGPSSLTFDEKGEPSFALKKLRALVGALGYDNTGELRFNVSDFISQDLDVEVGRKGASVDKETGAEYKATNTARAFYPHEMSESEMLS